MENAFKNKITDAIHDKAARFAEDRGLHLLRIQVRGTPEYPVLEILLDGERGILVEDCEAVSRDLSDAIDTGSLVKGNYRLDVMSPGLEEPLVHDWQFKRNLNRLVEVHYQDSGDHHTLHGHLREFSQKEIVIEPIHVKAKKPSAPKAVTTSDGPIVLQADEQLYDNPVALVKIEREHLTKVLVQAEMR